MNFARFTVNGVASTTRGVDLLAGASVTLALEAVTGVERRVEYCVRAASDEASPLASLSAPELTLAGATSGQRVQAATPGAAVTTTLPSGVHSWIVRCLVDGGVNIDGSVNPDYVFERMFCIRSPDGIRKVVATEGTQYSPRGWADAQNEGVDAGGGSGVIIRCAVGFAAAGSTPVTVNTGIIQSDDFVIFAVSWVYLATQGSPPRVVSIDPGVSFDVVCDAGDECSYSWAIVRPPVAPQE